jgi:hypothetical protein
MAPSIGCIAIWNNGRVKNRFLRLYVQFLKITFYAKCVLTITKTTKKNYLIWCSRSEIIGEYTFQWIIYRCDHKRITFTVEQDRGWLVEWETHLTGIKPSNLWQNLCLPYQSVSLLLLIRWVTQIFSNHGPLYWQIRIFSLIFRNITSVISHLTKADFD